MKQLNRSFLFAFFVVLSFSSVFAAAIKTSVVNLNFRAVSGSTIYINDQQDVSDSNGITFTNDLVEGETYRVRPEKLDKPLNSVTTYDMVLIAQHMIGTRKFDSPYKIIAADVNNSGDITTFDLVQLRQLILYAISDFPSNTSWKFIDKNYVFTDPSNPWAELDTSQSDPSEIVFSSLPAGVSNAVFIGVKIGDVNGGATSFDDEEIDNRQQSTLLFKIEDQPIKVGEIYTVDFLANDFQNILGYQFSMNYDLSLLEFIETSSATLNVSENNFGTKYTDQGVLTSSFHEARAQSIDDDQTLFSITFKARKNSFISKAIAISDQYTTAEAYQKNGDVKNLDIHFDKRDVNVKTEKEFELLQNKPNPFSESTLIGFQLSDSSSATISLYNSSGNLLKNISGVFERGYNEISIDRSTIGSAGVYFYKIVSDNYSKTKKMIVSD